MKKGIHPDNYRLVVFKDMSNDYAFLSKSCAPSKDSIKWEDGNEYANAKTIFIRSVEKMLKFD